MKKFISLIVAFSVLFVSVSALAMDLGGFGSLLDTLTDEDPEVKDVMDGLGSLFGAGSSDTKTEKEESEFPSLVGPFSGKTVKVEINKKTYTVHQEFKDALDKYEAYFDAYIEFMKHADAPDFAQKYLEFVGKYSEAMEALEKLDKMSDKEKNWSDEENAYFIQVQLRINEKLYTALGEM